MSVLETATNVSVMDDVHLKDGGLSQYELDEFNRTGLLGPFDGPLDDAEYDEMYKNLFKVIDEKTEHPLYKRHSVRDWHLVQSNLVKLISHEQVKNKLIQILGEDIVLWRSKIFYKRPGDAAVEWHQEWGAFNGEEIGNDKPSLIPAKDRVNNFWNLTIWVALEDVTLDMGAMQFIKGSYLTRYPIDMIPMTHSAFWTDPFLGIETKEELIDKTLRSQIILDIDSSKFLEGIDTESKTIDELKAIILKNFDELKGAITLPFEIKKDELVTIPVKQGQYIIFPERTMHRSLPNTVDKGRMAINFRITPSSTLIYPQRLDNDMIDGSNLDISQHQSILLNGGNLNEDNVLKEDKGV